ncbi:DUF2975 domain-containing protein [Empedobacter falsenii]
METKSKFYLKLIGVLILLLPFIDFFFNNGFNDFKRGWQNAEIAESYEYFDVVPNSAINQAVLLPKISGTIIPNKISLGVFTEKILSIYPFYIWVIYLLLAVAIIFYLFSLIRLIKRFIKGELFEQSTYHTLLYNGFAIIAFSMLDSTLNFIKNDQLQKYLVDSNYTISYNNMIDTSGLFIGLFVLAFAVALKQSLYMKQENDLTI